MPITQIKYNRMLILNELGNPENWKPVLTKIHDNTGIAISTVYDVIKEMKDKGIIDMNIKITIDKEILKQTKYL